MWKMDLPTSPGALLRNLLLDGSNALQEAQKAIITMKAKSCMRAHVAVP